MTPWWSGRNIDLYVGDAREVLTGFADESVDCIVTSPPYFGLRSYDTGRWEPNPGTCPHIPAPSIGQHCPHCDANWSDGQYGQEDTVEQYVHHLVAVFDQARRVLHRHGTLWLNLGDSYAGNKPRTAPKHGPNSVMRGAHNTGKWMTGTVEGIAPKNLIGIPWRVAFALQARGWLRNAIVWAKTNGQPSSVNDRLTTTYELVFLFTRSPRYHFNLDAIRIPVKHPNDKRRQKNPTGAKGKNPADVWAFPTRASREAHLAGVSGRHSHPVHRRRLPTRRDRPRPLQHWHHRRGCPATRSPLHRHRPQRHLRSHYPTPPPSPSPRRNGCYHFHQPAPSGSHPKQLGTKRDRLRHGAQ